MSAKPLVLQSRTSKPLVLHWVFQRGLNWRSVQSMRLSDGSVTFRDVGSLRGLIAGFRLSFLALSGLDFAMF